MIVGLSSTDITENTCASKVKEQYPEAHGATWYSDSSCWAEFGDNRIHSYSHRTCQFTGV